MSDRTVRGSYKLQLPNDRKMWFPNDLTKITGEFHTGEMVLKGSERQFIGRITGYHFKSDQNQALPAFSL